MKNIPDRYYESVVALGNRNQCGEFIPTATGFIYAHVIRDKEVEGSVNISFFLVTNKHFVEGNEVISVRINDYAGNSTVIYDIELMNQNKVRRYEFHPYADLVVVYMDLLPWANNEVSKGFVSTEEIVSSRQNFIELGISETDQIFLLGYPLGLVDNNRNFPFFRMGIISKLRNFLSELSREIVIDCQVYPGNSGGLVFLAPIINNNRKILYKNGDQMTYLLGIISGYIPYREVAISSQTGKPRIEFQENSGLGIVIPAFFIFECVENFVNYRLGLGGKINKHELPVE